MNKIVSHCYIILITMSMWCAGIASADQVVLCLNVEEQYIVKVDAKSDCIEGEQYAVLKGTAMNHKKYFEPVANFKKNEKCDGDGVIIEIGFDQNNNGQLDAQEREAGQMKCTTPNTEEETSSVKVES